MKSETLTAMGAVGVIPVHDEHLRTNNDVAGVNFSIPIYAGGLYSAKAKEAKLKAEAANETLKGSGE